MSAEKIKEELSKLLKFYYDIKVSSKYLIYFTQIPSSNKHQANNAPYDLRMNVTDGCHVWCKQIDENFLKNILMVQLEGRAADSLSYVDYLTSLNESLKTDAFDLANIVDTVTELIEFKSKFMTHEYRFLLNESKTAANDVKSLLFSLYERHVKLESELNRLNSRSDLLANSDTSANSSKSKANNASATSADGVLKKFNLTNGSQTVARKPGMSLINPMSKRKKTPKGVKFDDDEEHDQKSDDATNSDDSSVKFKRTLSSQSDS